MRYIWIVILNLFFIAAQAQDDYTFEVKTPTQVAVGQVFDIQFVISTSQGGIEATSPKFPAFKGLDVHFGPSQTQSSSTTIINGRRSQSVSLILYYRVSAPKAGMINFGPASIDIAGKTYKTQGVSIQVSKTAPAQQQQGGRQRTYSGQAQQSATPTKITDKEVNIKAVANKYSPYEGEEVLLTHTLNTNINIRQYNIHKQPSNQGFWSEILQNNAKPVQHGNSISLLLEKALIYPQHSGKMTVDPLEIEIIAQIRNQQRSNDPFEDFFGSMFGSVQQVQHTVRSNRITFNVKPLPEKGKPESFKGNVGRFTFKSDIDKTTLKANEALTISITIGGHGNLKHIEAPTVVFPTDFEVYEPQETDHIQVSESGMSGSKTFEFLAIPRTQGSYTIPPIAFSYFDPVQKKYIEHQTDEYKITVTKGDERFAATAKGSNSDNPYLNRDIEFIQARTSALQPINHKFLFSTLFWVLFALPFGMFGGFLMVRKQLDIRNADVVGLRNKRAFKEAKKNLRKAEKFMLEHNQNAFYIEISQALWGFLSKKFNIPVAELSIETVHQTLLGKNIQTEHIDAFLKALENCEFARFAPNGASAQSMQEVYDEALAVISSIVRHLSE
ncbi:MAG: BatD family protein [Bacteroidales bacterium]|jgi:hypothetical protein|nr:BatD family protein [Bacteroidales bacterium]